MVYVIGQIEDKKMTDDFPIKRSHMAASVVAAAGAAVALGLIGDAQVPPEQAFCRIYEGDAHPVRIISAFDGSVKRFGDFKVDHEKGTCSVHIGGGDRAIYKLVR